MYIRTFDLHSDYDSLDGFHFIFHTLLCKDKLELTDVLIFDIETTGFSPKNSFCYLIGCIYFKDDTFKFIQWFADSKEDEKEILEAFFCFLQNYKAVFHYNGNGFDIPYLMQKAVQYDLNETFDTKESIDLYKILSPYKNFFKLENLKQKTVENFLDIGREDKFTGGQLINVYTDYLSNPNEESKKLLLLHNKDDICGLFRLLPIFAYQALFNGLFTITGFDVNPYTDMHHQQQFEFSIELKLQIELPKRISHGMNEFYFVGNKKVGKLKVKVYSDELKYFYSNYKDYYYLPNEDMAVHKSIASYVDKEYRAKAKSANCYIRKSGHFLPQYQSIIGPCFKENYNDKKTYFELTDEVLNNDVLMKKYVLHALDVLVRSK